MHFFWHVLNRIIWNRDIVLFPPPSFAHIAIPFFAVPTLPHTPFFRLFVPFFKWEHLLSSTRNRLPVCSVFVCWHVRGRYVYVHSAESSSSNNPTISTQPPRPSFARQQAKFWRLCFLFKESKLEEMKPYCEVRLSAYAQLQALVVTWVLVTLTSAASHCWMKRFLGLLGVSACVW